jgi:anti-sigma factor RsiW
MDSDSNLRSSSSQLHCQTGVSMNRCQNEQQPPDTMDNFKRDRFELISAYLDGEVTADERRQVEGWLKHDASAQCLYTRLLKLRQSFRMMPVPPPEQPAEVTVQQIMNRVERRPRVAAAWGGAAIAAAFLGLLVHLPDLGSMTTQQLASRASDKTQVSKTIPTLVESDALMIALDRPIIEIPKAPTSAIPLAGSLEVLPDDSL